MIRVLFQPEPRLRASGASGNGLYGTRHVLINLDSDRHGEATTKALHLQPYSLHPYF